ncbi:hypothetical protein NE237_016595 [Protea cynaroides]|uniref:Amino acid transporter transmembrane domain-containing protein n=1 Tax=Protea cynaroides TaxID=273540 RepID=A0A9Q0HDT0_9MAGN|nr:hypothetical protein NE237_016595 [Protea cynaroides]
MNPNLQTFLFLFQRKVCERSSFEREWLSHLVLQDEKFQREDFVTHFDLHDEDLKPKTHFTPISYTWSYTHTCLRNLGVIDLACDRDWGGTNVIRIFIRFSVSVLVSPTSPVSFTTTSVDWPESSDRDEFLFDFPTQRRNAMITRSNLAEQLREYQIRAKHDWASGSFFTSTANLSSRADGVIYVAWELIILAFLVVSAVSLYFKYMRLTFILICITMLLLAAIVATMEGCLDLKLDEEGQVRINHKESNPTHDGGGPVDAWLPITESRNGNAFYSAFHSLNSGIGFQALLLPLAFTILGWTWGITRYSRYLQLAKAAFAVCFFVVGEKRGKLMALFPIMYLSGGTCVALITFGGGAMKLFFQTVCGATCLARPLTTVEWFSVFTCSAFVLAQLPNLNSIACVSLIGSVTAVSYCTIIWVLSVIHGRVAGASYEPLQPKSEIAKTFSVLNALVIIAFSFRGHNLVLEIQGTMPSTQKHSSLVPMWKGVKFANLLIALCFYPVAIAGYWSYGNLNLETKICSMRMTLAVCDHVIVVRRNSFNGETLEETLSFSPDLRTLVADFLNSKL